MLLKVSHRLNAIYVNTEDPQLANTSGGKQIDIRIKFPSRFFY